MAVIILVDFMKNHPLNLSKFFDTIKKVEIKEKIKKSISRERESLRDKTI